MEPVACLSLLTGHQDHRRLFVNASELSDLPDISQRVDCYVVTVCSKYIAAPTFKVKVVMLSDVWLTVHRNSVWIRKTN